MILLVLEALGALFLLLLIVWWTMFSGRKSGELPVQAEPEQLEALLVNLKQIAHIAGTEINRASLACVRLRGGSPQPDPSPTKPTLH